MPLFTSPGSVTTLAVSGAGTIGGTLDVTGYTTLAGAQTNSDFASLGNISVSALGKSLRVKEGVNACMGTATLNGITEVTVSTTAVTANSRIFVTVDSPAGTVGGLGYVSSRIAGTSFGLKSVTVGDTSTVAWMIVEPA